jgi:hypothetical protein
MDTKFIGYWHWFLKGSGDKAGFRRIFNVWILLHLIIGFVMTLLVEVDLQTAANAVLLPLAGIFVGLSFAWAGNAQALMQTSEIDEMADFHEGGFEEYVFVYQTAILTILVTLVFWGIAGLSVFDKQWPTQKNTDFYFGIKIILFTLSSITLRECWHVVMGAQWMLLVQRKIRRSKAEKNNRK